MVCRDLVQDFVNLSKLYHAGNTRKITMQYSNDKHVLMSSLKGTSEMSKTILFHLYCNILQRFMLERVLSD